MELNAEKLCRLCCQKKNRMRSLFEERADYPLSLQQIILDVSRLEVEPNDGMPQQACPSCATTLLKIHKSVETFRASDLKLRQQFGRLLPVEIKEEEVDVEMLEKAFTQELEVDGIRVKQEAVDEEYLDSEQKNDNSLTTSQKQGSKTVSLKRDIVDSGSEDDTVVDAKDNEWKPSEQDTEPKAKKRPMKKARRKVSPQKDADGEPKPARRRRKPGDPLGPRLQDYKCYICKSESHGSSEALITHLTASHEDLLPFTCSECVMETVVIRTIQKLNVHMRQHLNPEKCPHCDKRLSDKKALRQHVQTYHLPSDAQGPLACKYCGEEYTSKASLIHHMKLHTTAASCEICGKLFRERIKLRLHIQRKHEKLKKHECSICQKKLASLDSLQVHLKSAHSNQVFKCSYCPKTYTTEQSLRGHEKRHIEEPDYVVNRDWKEYYTVVEGQENESSSRKLKKCNICGFVSKAIGSHLASVHFPTEFRCSICGQTLKNKQRYKAHVQEHEKGKAERCPICGRGFSNRRSLIVHLRTKQHQDHPLAQADDCDDTQEQNSNAEDRRIEDSL